MIQNYVTPGELKDALLSGDYKLGRGRLKHAGRHCCLGVLAELQGIEPEGTHTLRYGERPGWLDQVYLCALIEANDATPYGQTWTEDHPVVQLLGKIEEA